MLTGVIEWSLGNRALVVALFVLMAVGGLYAATQIPVDAVPDLVNVQVQVVTEAGSLPPLEVERSVTYPVEMAMSGLPDVEEMRSVSRLASRWSRSCSGRAPTSTWPGSWSPSGCRRRGRA